MFKNVPNASDIFNTNNFDPANMLVFGRDLVGDFSTLGKKIQQILSIQDNTYKHLSLSDFENLQSEFARLTTLQYQKTELSVIHSDLLFLARHGTEPYLRIKCGATYENSAVSSFHPDGVSRILIPYNDPVPLWLEDDNVMFDEEATKRYGQDSYKPINGAEVHQMTVGSMWHFLGLESGFNTLPLMHKGVDSKYGSAPLLVAFADPCF